MALITDGPIFSAFKSVLAGQKKPLGQETEDCSVSVVNLLEHHHTTAHRPGMLLGKVQSGKTRAFLGTIAIGFDNGFDIAVVLTKTSTPLATQTISRLSHDLAPAIDEHRLRILDCATKIKKINEWTQGRKLIFVAKKHPKNLENLKQALLVDHPALRKKKVMIIDDEADFASVGYERKKGEGVKVRSVQTLIDSLRTDMPHVSTWK